MSGMSVLVTLNLGDVGRRAESEFPLAGRVSDVWIGARGTVLQEFCAMWGLLQKR